MMQPEASWVARWLRMSDGGAGGGGLKPGLYAIALPGDAEEVRDDAGSEYEDDGADAEEGEEEELELASGVGGAAPAAAAAAAAPSASGALSSAGDAGQ